MTESPALVASHGSPTTDGRITRIEARQKSVPIRVIRVIRGWSSPAICHLPSAILAAPKRSEGGSGGGCHPPFDQPRWPRPPPATAFTPLAGPLRLASAPWFAHRSTLYAFSCLCQDIMHGHAPAARPVFGNARTRCRIESRRDFGWHRRPACTVRRLAGRNGGNAPDQSTRPSRKVATHTSGREVAGSPRCRAVAAGRAGRVARTTHFSDKFSVLLRRNPDNLSRDSQPSPPNQTAQGAVMR